MQYACTQQALTADEDGEDYGPQITKVQEAIRLLRESERLTLEYNYPPDETTSVVYQAWTLAL